MAKLCSCLWVLWGESFRWSTEEGMPFWKQILAWKSYMTGVWCCTLQHQAATSTQSADFAEITTVTVAMNGPAALEADSLHPLSLQRAGKCLTVTCSAMITVVIIAPVALRPSEANLVGISTVASWLTPIVYLPTARAKLTPTCSSTIACMTYASIKASEGSCVTTLKITWLHAWPRASRSIAGGLLLTVVSVP